MGKVFTLLLGKGEEELKEILEDVNAKLKEDPNNEELIEEKIALEEALNED